MKKLGSYLNQPKRIAYIFLMPSLLILFVFAFIPLLGSIVIGFMNLDIYFSNPGFAGFANFARALADLRFWNALKNTTIFAVVEVPLQIGIGLLVATAVASSNWFSKVSRSIMFIPVVCSMAAIGIAWNILLDGTIGLVPYLLEKVLGIQDATFFRNPAMAMPTVIAMTVWKNFGYTMSILVVGINSISQSYYEAAQLDGAGKVKQFIHITLPGLAPNIGFCLITNLIGSLQVFDQAYVTTQGGPQYKTETLVMYLYKSGFSAPYDLGYASGMSVLMLVLILAISLPLYLKLFRSNEEG